MRLLELKLEFNNQAFISKTKYIENGFKIDDRPSEARIFHWF